MTVRLQTPLAEADVRKLHAGDRVLISGRICTGRDAVHKLLADGEPPPCDLRRGVIFHCGPVVRRENDTWHIIAAGPTTSIREEPYMADLIRTHSLRAVIGKGGMGPATARACREHGCVYLHAVGGAAQVLARTVDRVRDVHYLDRFGVPEAMWELEVSDFPARVTMDSHGKNLHERVRRRAERNLRRLCAVVAVAAAALFTPVLHATPRIAVVGQNTRDLGRFPSGRGQTTRFTIRNDGDDPLRIIRVRRTCGCSDADADRNRLAPGETATVTVRIRPNTLSGTFSKAVFVVSDDPQRSTLPLFVRGEAVSRIRVTPSTTIYNGALEIGRPWTARFTIETNEPNLTLGEPRLETNHPAEAQLVGSPENPAEPVHLTVTVTPKNGDDLHCTVTVPVRAGRDTDPPRPVVVTVEGKIRNTLLVVPPTLELPADAPVPVTRVFWLRLPAAAATKQNGTVTDLKWTQYDGVTLSVRYAATASPTIRITCTPAFLRKLARAGSLPIRFKLPGVEPDELTLVSSGRK